jgi:hypothetical protein
MYVEISNTVREEIIENKSPTMQRDFNPGFDLLFMYLF